MRHARAEDLEVVAELLKSVRAIPDLKERTTGSFYRKGAGILHFHEDSGALYADVKIDGSWTRLPMRSATEQAAVLKLVRKHYG